MLSFYFYPDLCAGSFRCQALINELAKREGVTVDLITTMPNRYASFDVDAKGYEEIGNTRVHRIQLPDHKSGFLDQAKAFFSYMLEARKIASAQSYDVVFATSSRLFTAFLGALIARQKKTPLYLDIRDIFVDTVADILPAPILFPLKPFFVLVEKYTFNSASKINLVSKGFSGYFEKKFPGKFYRWYTNGIDPDFQGSAESSPELGNDRTRLLYAGNIGEGQGLDAIIPKLALRLGEDYEILVIGDGGKKEKLKQSLREMGVDNVTLRNPVSRDQLIREYNQADILFLHLNDYPAFEKVIPSKIFEYAAVGKPILAGVKGYPKTFIESEVSNANTFDPCNDVSAEAAIKGLALSITDREEFVKKFGREKIMKDLVDDLLVVIEERGDS